MNPRAEKIHSAPGRWLRLLLAVAGIWAFVFVIAPWLQRGAWVHSVHENTRARGIRATGLFYTDTEVFSEAELFLRAARTTGMTTAAAPRDTT